MKKFFEKHDLFKLASIFVIISIILTWVCKYSYYSGGELVTDEIKRIGIFDLSTYGLLGVYYFTVSVIFVFIVAGFYKVIGSVPAYQIITSNVAKKLEGKEKLFAAISILIYAILASIVTDYMVLLALIPLSITIMSKLKFDKVSALASTFGGVLVGILGATYSDKIVKFLVDSTSGLGVSYGYEIVAVLVLAGIAYVLLTYFTISRLNKKTDDVVEDLFASEEKVIKKITADEPVKVEVKEEKNEDKKYVEKKHKKHNSKANLAKDNGEVKKVKIRKISTLPFTIVLCLTFIITILAFINWEGAFSVTLFTDVHKWVTEATIFDVPIFSYILGGYFNAFGSWDLFGASSLLLIAMLIIKIIYHMPLDVLLDKISEGFKSINKTVLIVLTIYLVLETAVIYPTLPAIVTWIAKLGNNFATWFAGGVLTSIFAVDFQYVMNLVGGYFASVNNVKIAALALQTSYGLVSFLAPTSLMLMIGLSMLNIKYSSWFKFIWKFAVAILIVIMAIFAILTFI